MSDNLNEGQTIDRSTRESSSRSSIERRQPWRPPNILDAPSPPDGYKHRWIRESILNEPDVKNMTNRIREGFELVRAEEYPDWNGTPVIEEGKHAGIIGQGGLLLARIPIETVREREAYYSQRTQEQMDAVDNDLFKEEHPSMPIHKPERRTKVTFGGQKPARFEE